MTHTAGPAAFVGACSAYLPARIVDNTEMAAATGTDAEWIARTSGIETRRYAADDESVIDMAVAAASACLRKAGTPKVDLVIVASGTSDRAFPGPAARVAQALQLGSVPALDVTMASAGSLFALVLASRLTGAYPNILVVGAEKMSAVVGRPGTASQIAVLFGDGAGACLVSTHGGQARIVDALVHSDGAFADALQLPHEGPMQMDGRTVIMQAARKVPQTITDLLARHDIPVDRVAAFLLHQANRNLTDQVAKVVGAPRDRFVSNVERYGNTSSASLLIAAAEWAESGGAAAGAPIVFAAFGAGLHWGALLALAT